MGGGTGLQSRVQQQATTNPTMAAAGKNRPLEAHRRPCVLRRRVGLIAEDPPRKRICFLFGLKGCMALKMLLCCGDASSPEQRSALKAIDTLTPPPKAYPLARGIVHDQSDALSWDARPLVRLYGPIFTGGGRLVSILYGTVFYCTVRKTILGSV